jgi:hypothetical protein
MATAGDRWRALPTAADRWRPLPTAANDDESIMMMNGHM